MKRRQYLALLASTTAVSSGCLSDEEESASGDTISGPTAPSEVTPTTQAQETTTPTQQRDSQTQTKTPTPDSENSVRNREANTVGEPVRVPGFAELTEHKWTTEYNHKGYPAGIIGRLKNIGNNRIGNIHTEANFLDQEGTIIGHGWDDVNFIRPDEHYDVRISYSSEPPAERIEQYELRMVVNQQPITPVNTGQIRVDNRNQGEVSDETYGVSGLATNVTDDRLTNAIMNVTFYSGNHILYQRIDKASHIEPGQSFRWSVGYHRDQPSYEAVDNHTLVVQVTE